LVESNSNSLSITNSTATFDSNLPANNGVGDVIQYDSDNDDVIDALAFFSGRTDAKNFTVKSVSGNTPIAVSSDADWSIFRAYTSLSDAEAGIENVGIDAGLQDFDTWNDGKNLVSADEQWNLACYGDAEDVTETGVVIRDWTTDADNYLKIYTPFLTSEVGTTQRHNGAWDENAYQLVISPEGFPDGPPISINTGSDSTSVNVWIDGLQIFYNNEIFASPGIEIYNVSGETKISNSIIKTDPLITTSFGITIDAISHYGAYKIWNNIIYGFADGGISLKDLHNTLYAYNNTVFGNGTGGSCYNRVSGTFVAKNNIAQNCAAGFAGVFDENSGYNISDLEDVAGTHSKNLTSLVFAATGNYHLNASDTAPNAGINLSADENLSFSTDIDNDSRVNLWYIGADERTPDTTQTCTDFSYTEWAECQFNGTQTREATGYPNGCAGGNQEPLSQSCTYIPPTCTEFVYSAWGECQSNSTQTRSLSSSSPANCVGETVLSQGCTYVAPKSSGGSSSHNKKKKKKKKSSSSFSIKTSIKKVSRGQKIIQSGKKFSKNSLVRVYFASGASKLVKTTTQGTFSLTYRIPLNKPSGSYSWFAVDLAKNKRSKNSVYRVR